MHTERLDESADLYASAAPKQAEAGAGGCLTKERFPRLAKVTLTGENWELEHTLEEAERGEGLQCWMIRKKT